MAGAPGNYSARINRTPPDKGSFPIDHENACKTTMVEYLKCLAGSKFANEKCRQQSKEYLKCRMDNKLMAKEEWSKLGFDDG